MQNRTTTPSKDGTCFIFAYQFFSPPEQCYPSALKYLASVTGLQLTSRSRAAADETVDFPAAGRNEPNGRRTFHIGARVRLCRCDQCVTAKRS